jgi:hypothetical protein
LISLPLDRRILQSPFGNFATKCLGIFLNRVTDGELVLAAPVSFDMFADAVHGLILANRHSSQPSNVAPSQPVIFFAISPSSTVFGQAELLQSLAQARIESLSRVPSP